MPQLANLTQFLILTVCNPAGHARPLLTADAGRVAELPLWNGRLYLCDPLAK